MWEVKGREKSKIVRKKKNVNSSNMPVADQPTHQINHQTNNQQSQEVNVQTRMVIDVL